MVRHGDWWYLFYSGGHCCTPPCTYKLGVARSRSALGPFVRRDEPLLRSNDQVACPGHGTLFTNGTGGWYMVHHGFVDGSGQRMPMISTIEWEEDGWPEVNNGFGALRDLDELADLTAAKVAAAAQAAIP
jgi:beta-xylosidase